MKIAVVYDGFVRQVLEIEDLKDLPDNFTFEIDGKEVTKEKKEVKLLNVKTDVQVGDKYVSGKGIFRLVSENPPEKQELPETPEPNTPTGTSITKSTE